MLTSSVVHAASCPAHRPSPRGFLALMVHFTQALSIASGCGAPPNPLIKPGVNIADPDGMVTHRAPILAETALIFQSSFGTL
jgi:hypothetical protein